ncbi:MAG: DUF4105 domain-containing protein [Marinifilaceae bacterium]
MKNIILSILFLLSAVSGYSENAVLGSEAQISVLTCDPGEELYSLFGHTAIRVTDPEQNLDIVFNYGTFDFRTDNFYLKYIKGLLPYQLTVARYAGFYASYVEERRTVWSQTLELDSLSKQRVWTGLLDNLKPENREYLYNFLFDNCTTRSRDIIVENTLPAIAWKLENKNYSFWNLLDQYLDYAPWSQWGIHTILGQSGMRKATPYQYMFLPDYFMYGLDSARYNDKLLVKERTMLYNSGTQLSVPTWYKTPYTVFSICAILISLILFYFKDAWIINTISCILYVSSGALGWLMLFLSYFTLHPMTSPNWNLLWAVPLNMFLPLVIMRRQLFKWVKWYLVAYSALQAITLCIWYFLFPGVSLSTMPIIALLLFNSSMLIARKK